MNIVNVSILSLGKGVECGLWNVDRMIRIIAASQAVTDTIFNAGGQNRSPLMFFSMQLSSSPVQFESATPSRQPHQDSGSWCQYALYT